MKTIIEMAREAGLERGGYWEFDLVRFERFVELVRADRGQSQVCCEEYNTCVRPCTPRGRHLAQPAQPEQEPVAWVSEDVCEGQYIDGRPRKIWWECSKGVGTAFYTTSPLPVQPEERNFCPRCGKRTADLTTIHTCTPPQVNT